MMAGNLARDMSHRRIEHSVGLGEGIAAPAGDFVLITYALGSCVGLTLWDPVARIGGMVHSQLPVSSIDARRAENEPFLFTDTAVAELLRRLYALGAEQSRVIARLAGCAESPAVTGSNFRVGNRNLAVARRVLWKNDILVRGEDVGADRPRTLVLDMNTGVTMVRSDGQCRIL